MIFPLGETFAVVFFRSFYAMATLHEKGGIHKKTIAFSFQCKPCVPEDLGEKYPLNLMVRNKKKEGGQEIVKK